jgi:hypothetical protein
LVAFVVGMSSICDEMDDYYAFLSFYELNGGIPPHEM